MQTIEHEYDIVVVGGGTAGALLAQYQGFADVQMGIGMVVWGLASVIIGEALVGTLQEKGTPEVVQRVLVAPPQSRIGPLTETERTVLIAGSPFKGRYDKPIDRESAYEILMGRKGLAPEAEAPAASQEPSLADRAGEFLGTAAGQALKSAMRQAANNLGKQLVRGLSFGAVK